MTAWTRVADPVADAALLPAWLVGRMLAARPGGAFGLLLTTGDVLRVRTLAAAHVSSAGTILLDVELDHAGVPAGVDQAWQSKHYLGAPVPGLAAQATVNLAQVVLAVAFAEGPAVEGPGDAATEANISATVGELREAAEAVDAPAPG
ncbi:hypothetical protein ACFQY5_16545 [Paeniroseomonas aquatica]|uniref:Uncharacterized protein n=1 Tax=Paeniroseomonas aquatica TaxID=373043 RepID=A0ABT8AFP0_9PROT|nr:hypothetical protein [Paeniroseomonas aquatica]MDN3568503.1 hypothetical protein [Paeniroseomonas aquatica]